MADTPNGETGNQPPLKNDANPVVTPSSTPDPAVEQARREKEQAEMRARQLENQLAELKKREDEQRQRELEEQNQWKEIAEQEKAKREALESEKNAAIAKVELEQAQDEVFKDFPPEVVELAKEADLTLSQNTEEAKAKLKSTLEKISSKVATDKTVRPNNQPNNQNNAPKSRDEILQQYATDQRPSTLDAALSELAWVKVAKAQNGEE